MVDKQSTLREMALFAGAGGGILGGHLLGWRTVCAVEWDIYAACVLAARQNDGILPSFPIWDDIQTFDGTKWRGLVDVVSGGFPCTDISAAGKGAGITGSKSSMWKHMARIINEVRPGFAFVENSPLLVGRGAAMVIGDLTEMGYDCEWCIVSASDVGAPHQRDRFWLKAKWRGQFSHSKHNRIGWWEQQPRSIEEANVSHTNLQHDKRRPESHESISTSGKAWAELDGCNSNVAYTDSTQCEGSGISSGIPPQNSNIGGYGSNAEVSDTASIRQSGQGEYEQPFNTAESCNGQTNNAQSIGRQQFWAIEPDVGRVAHGVAARVDRLKAIGNGQVPAVAATAWSILNGT
jgi:DNA (cytosine-5)-methyltransferase 1